MSFSPSPRHTSFCKGIRPHAVSRREACTKSVLAVCLLFSFKVFLVFISFFSRGGGCMRWRWRQRLLARQPPVDEGYLSCQR